MNSNIVYDLIQYGFQGWKTPVKNSIIPLLVIIIFITYEKIKSSQRSKSTLGYLFVFLMWIFIDSVWIFFSYSDYVLLKNVMEKNEYKIATGYVRNNSLVYGKLDKQYFTVDNVDFMISDNMDNGGFNNTYQKGGPLYDGVCVKILYFNRSNENIILHLEFIKDSICKETKK